MPKREPTENDLLNIDYLFDLFLEVWDESWARKITGNPGKKRQWAEMLTGRTREELQEAHSLARETYDTVPTPKQFIALLPPQNIINQEMTPEKAEKITLDKLKKRMPFGFRNKEEYFLEREIFSNLYSLIRHTGNEHCDFSICEIENCYQFKIFEKPFLGIWWCQQHEGKK
jgi:hypothetical protein